jgi:hypothetical protein
MVAEKQRERQEGGCLIPALRRLRQEDCEFETSLGYIVKQSLSRSRALSLSRSLSLSHTHTHRLREGANIPIPFKVMRPMT